MRASVWSEMLVLGNLGFQALLFLLLALLFLWLQGKWRSSSERKEEIKRLVETVSRESDLAEFHSVYEYSALPKPHLCAVCLCPTTNRCSGCKSVRYCSGKCQIIHWRQGHKDECERLTSKMHLKQGSDPCGRATLEKISEVHAVGIQSSADISYGEEHASSGIGELETPCEDISPAFLGTQTSAKERHKAKIPHPKSTELVSSGSGVSHVITLNKAGFKYADEKLDLNSRLSSEMMAKSDDGKPAKISRKKSMRRAASSEMFVTDASKVMSFPSSSTSGLDSFNNEEENDSQMFGCKEVRSFSFSGSSHHQQDAHNELEKSPLTKVQHFRASKESYIDKIIFPYELFVKLYSCNEELYPFGLRNSGNSCYANAVLQCLAFTRPLTSYFAKEGESPLSPSGILSKIEKFGSHLGHGNEEDAHEFLRYAVDTMQSVCLKEAGALGPLAEETNLVGLTFGGYLRSKIMCMRCRSKSETFERMMDLTVEIDGNIRTLDEALAQFTADEILDGENKYNCSRCKSYVKGKKKLTVSEAPNILTIVLKRFQSGNLEKLNKSVRFPELLDLGPYMYGKSDKSPQYSLYAVVVHKDTMNSTSSGHYVCYVKSLCGGWFGINDSTVIAVELERVLLEGAYILLYARHYPRGPALLSNTAASKGTRLKKKNSETVCGSNTSKLKYSYQALSSEPSKAHKKHGKHHSTMIVDDSSVNGSHDLDDWRFYSMQRVRRVDSSSESSSIFSSSDASSCSTSTKGSVRSDDLSDFLFGGLEPGWYDNCGRTSNSVAPTSCRNSNVDAQRRKDAWRQLHSETDWR
ncbi:hypothetical protein Tsubulata_032831 [Turnera subulata]|uniref:Ubiquitinyl hydrolase 1 n=1 Tax=Turnera subulata TaxID=218843 RepID=A0A9Q0J3B0_9ROSI|nr:hypothetical protein Tsubulata_032831 [Turnera subulata]